LAGSREWGDEPSGSGVMELVNYNSFHPAKFPTFPVMLLHHLLVSFFWEAYLHGKCKKLTKI
jgi:hypothetical protein